ncbi:ribonuclease H-like domain-containing protein [Phascolomyces articulosus]|uniref:Ribonuclease H-like domain-containing protein n=1 Tax=Phascolomyces articulosus TaxID=60185 RepID=A0AAD5K0I7_9FUNG|nr:ribonuclease H-like domain-containing protein [Phascolomyces articulosus]
MVAYTEVSTENLSDLYDVILDKVSHAQYIAIDCEFTGHLRDLITNMEHRYDGMAQVVRSHTILSVGLTTITADRKFDNFEFLLNNQTPYQSNAANLKFLAENGFDFNRHYSVGIPFRPGPFSATSQATAAVKSNGSSNTLNKNKNTLKGKLAAHQRQKLIAEKQERQIRELWFDIFNLLRTKNIPLIVHNGLLDLMYIYQCFITSLPAKLSGFVADMVEAFPGGIYDTKYIANHVSYEQTTFLAYLYHKYSRTGFKVQVQQALVPTRNSHDSTTDDNIRSNKRQRTDTSDDNKKVKVDVCNSFAARGWCADGQACERSHDINRILDRDQKVDTITMKSPTPSTTTIPTTPSEQGQQSASSLPQKSNSGPKKEHSSHYDAYMTGYTFCYMTTQYQGDALQNEMNKLNIMKLDVPLRITKSNYAKPTLQWNMAQQHLQNRLKR